MAPRRERVSESEASQTRWRGAVPSDRADRGRRLAGPRASCRSISLGQCVVGEGLGWCGFRPVGWPCSKIARGGGKDAVRRSFCALLVWVLMHQLLPALRWEADLTWRCRMIT